MNNNMGIYQNSEPKNLHKFNWGAFVMNVFWGIGNKSYLTLWCLVPFFNLIWMFVCGFKGNEWAWNSGCFKTVEEFEATQKTWNRAGIAALICMIVSYSPYIVMLWVGVISNIF